jgi:peroxiredoxin
MATTEKGRELMKDMIMKKVKEHIKTVRVGLRLLVWTAILFIFISIPNRAYADHWKVMGSFRLSGTMATDFTLQSLDGESVTLSDLRGKVVLINFWTTWCQPCIIEMPSMEKLYRKYKDKGFTILAIDIMEKPETIRKFAKEKNLTFPILLDTKGEVRGKYRVTGIPNSYLVHKDGKLVGRFIGPREWDNEHAEALLEELLGE